MAGNRDDSNEELLISPALLEHLFRPLQDALKENGEAIIELTDQMKLVVSLHTTHPTRQSIIDQLKEHNAQAFKILEETRAAKATLVRWMWTVGVIWAAVEAIQSYHYVFK